MLVTYASNAPEIVGQLLPLTKPQITIGRRGDQDLVVTEATVSGGHATLRWQTGSWVLDDLGSTNGSYADHSYDRKAQVTVMHGGEAQVGELRLKLVSFQPDSPHHRRARQFLAIARARGLASPSVQPAVIDGSVGLIVAPGGRLDRVLRFAFAGGKVARIEVLADPARLRDLEIAVL